MLQNLSREIRVLGMIRRRTIIATLILQRMRSGASCSNIAELSGKITVAKHLATLLALVVELTVDTGTETKWREIMVIRSAGSASSTSRTLAVSGRACPITVATLAPPAVPSSRAVRRRRRDALGE